MTSEQNDKVVELSLLVCRLLYYFSEVLFPRLVLILRPKSSVRKK
jgi:hypothetical protein